MFDQRSADQQANQRIARRSAATATTPGAPPADTPAAARWRRRRSINALSPARSADALHAQVPFVEFHDVRLRPAERFRHDGPGDHQHEQVPHEMPRWQFRDRNGRRNRDARCVSMNRTKLTNTRVTKSSPAHARRSAIDHSAGKIASGCRANSQAPVHSVKPNTAVPVAPKSTPHTRSWGPNSPATAPTSAKTRQQPGQPRYRQHKKSLR